MKRTPFWIVCISTALAALALVQTVFLVVQARQGKFLLQGLTSASSEPIDAAHLTSRLEEFSKMGWIRCFQLAEEIPSAEQNDDHSCGRISWLEGVTPVSRRVLASEGKVFEIRIETIPSPEFEGLLWISRTLALLATLSLGLALRN